MSGLSIGLSTFNSCNKAGSIPYFTQHLTRYPNDYQALTWRGRAYSIIGKLAEAKADFQKACRVSYGSQKRLAQAHIEHIDGNVEQKVAILQTTTRQYPNCSEAWHELGSHTYKIERKVDLSLQYLEKANQLATINSETKDPWYPWCNQTIGDIYLNQKQQVNDARKHYATAVQSSDTLTIGHLGLSRCDILNNDLARAKTSFLTAKRLNPELVKWETFDDFRLAVQTDYTISSFSHFFRTVFDFPTDKMQDVVEKVLQQQVKEKDPSSFQYVSGAGSRDTGPYLVSGAGSRDTRPYPVSGAGSHSRSSRIVSKTEHPFRDREFERNMAPSFNQRVQCSTSGAKSRNQSRRSVSGYQGGGTGGMGNGGAGDGSGRGGGNGGKKVLTPEQREEKWKEIKNNAPSAKKYRGKRFYQSQDRRYWYTKIEVAERHGRETKSFLKRYKDKGRTIELDVSIDENWNEMPGKHESGKYDVIKKSDMEGIYSI